MQTITINGAELKRAADASPEFLLLAYYAANRQRNRVSTDIRQMRKNLIGEGETIDPARWIEAWRKLEALNMGSLIIGRNGKATRFKWNYSLKAVGRAAINGMDIRVVPINARLRGSKHVHEYHDRDLVREPITVPMRKEAVSTKPVEVPIVKTVIRESIKNVVHVSLRPDYSFEADLPKLSQSEADAICAAIKRCV